MQYLYWLKWSIDERILCHWGNAGVAMHNCNILSTPIDLSNQTKQQWSFFPAFLSFDLYSFGWLKECWLSNPHVETVLFLSLCLFVSKATVWSQGNSNICRTYTTYVWVQLHQAISHGLPVYQQKHPGMQISSICLHGIKAGNSCWEFNNIADI